MHITDPVADMLTRIRNANNAKHDTVDVPASNMKKSDKKAREAHVGGEVLAFVW